MVCSDMQLQRHKKQQDVSHFQWKPAPRGSTGVRGVKMQSGNRHDENRELRKVDLFPTTTKQMHTEKLPNRPTGAGK